MKFNISKYNIWFFILIMMTSMGKSQVFSRLEYSPLMVETSREFLQQVVNAGSDHKTMDNFSQISFDQLNKNNLSEEQRRIIESSASNVMEIINSEINKETILLPTVVTINNEEKIKNDTDMVLQTIALISGTYTQNYKFVHESHAVQFRKVIKDVSIVESKRRHVNEMEQQFKSEISSLSKNFINPLHEKVNIKSKSISKTIIAKDENVHGLSLLLEQSKLIENSNMFVTKGKTIFENFANDLATVGANSKTKNIDLTIKSNFHKILQENNGQKVELIFFLLTQALLYSGTDQSRPETLNKLIALTNDGFSNGHMRLKAMLQDVAVNSIKHRIVRTIKKQTSRNQKTIPYLAIHPELLLNIEVFEESKAIFDISGNTEYKAPTKEEEKQEQIEIKRFIHDASEQALGGKHSIYFRNTKGNKWRRTSKGVVQIIKTWIESTDINPHVKKVVNKDLNGIYYSILLSNDSSVADRSLALYLLSYNKCIDDVPMKLRNRSQNLTLIKERGNNGSVDGNYDQSTNNSYNMNHENFYGDERNYDRDGSVPSRESQGSIGSSQYNNAQSYAPNIVAVNRPQKGQYDSLNHNDINSHYSSSSQVIKSQNNPHIDNSHNLVQSSDPHSQATNGNSGHQAVDHNHEKGKDLHSNGSHVNDKHDQSKDAGRNISQSTNVSVNGSNTNQSVSHGASLKGDIDHKDGHQSNQAGHNEEKAGIIHGNLNNKQNIKDHNIPKENHSHLDIMNKNDHNHSVSYNAQKGHHSQAGEINIRNLRTNATNNGTKSDTGHETVSTGHETVSTGHKTVSTVHETVSTGHETVSTVHETVSTGHETVSTGHNKKKNVENPVTEKRLGIHQIADKTTKHHTVLPNTHITNTAHSQSTVHHTGSQSIVHKTMHHSGNIHVQHSVPAHGNNHHK